MKKSLLLLLLSLLCICSMSQNKGEYSLSTFGQWGWVVPTNGFLGGNNSSNTPISQMYVASLRFVKHTSGDKYWHQLYDYPSFGVGVSGAAFNVPNQLGEPSTLYAFLSKPIVQRGKYSLFGDYSVGITYNWLHFTTEHPERTAMGAAASCYLDASFVLKRQMGKNFDLGLGLSFSHYSNGAIKRPNHGVNVLSAKLSVDYFPKGKVQHTILPLPDFEGHIIDLWSGFVGSHNFLTVLSSSVVDEPYISRSYFVCGIDRRVLWRFNLKHSLGVGIGVGYDQYVGTSYRVFSRKPYFYEINHADRLNFSAYISYEYRIHRLGIVLEPGIYLYKNKLDESRPLFQRVGLRYYMKNSCFFGANLRAAQFSVAQYIEWTFGYAIEN